MLTNAARPPMHQPRSAERMQPTAQAVGKIGKMSKSPVGAKENYLHREWDIRFGIRRRSLKTMLSPIMLD